MVERPCQDVDYSRDMTNLLPPLFCNVLTSSKHAEDTSFEAARKLITQEATGSRRVTKKALLESIGYGVSAADSSL